MGAGWQRHAARQAMVVAFGRAGVDGGGVLPHEPDHAAVESVVRCVFFTVCRVIQRLGPLLALEPIARRPDVSERLWIVNGILVPVRDRQVGSSSCSYRFPASVQGIVDADTPLVIIAARPAPGATAGAHAWRASAPADHCQGMSVPGGVAHLTAG